MTLRIGLDGDEPPTGVVVGSDDIPVPFAGWLELIQAISQVARQRVSPTVAAAVPERAETGP